MKEFKYVLSGIILIFIIFNIDTYSSFTEIEISTLIFSPYGVPKISTSYQLVSKVVFIMLIEKTLWSNDMKLVEDFVFEGLPVFRLPGIRRTRVVGASSGNPEASGSSPGLHLPRVGR